METNIFIAAISILVSVVVMAIYNQNFIRWQQGKEDRSDWKRDGLILRILLLTILVVILWPDVEGLFLYLSAFLFVSYPLWNIIIAVKLGQQWYYIGGTGTIDKLLKKHPKSVIISYVVSLTLFVIALITRIT